MTAPATAVTPPAAQAPPPKGPPKANIDTIRDLITKYKGHMAALLPKHLDAERLFRVAMLVVGRNPKLGECHPATLLGCVLESTRLGLEPGAGAGETWLVPFRNKDKNRVDCQLIIDYRGLIKLIKRANKEVNVVLAERVCAKDRFAYGIADGGPYLRWEPAQGDRGPAVAYFAAVWDKAKTLLTYHVKTKEEVDKVRKRSKAGGDGPWVTDYEPMALKTVLRPAGKYLVGENAELQRGLALDERAALALPQDMGTLADPTETETPEAPPEGSVPEPQRASAQAPAAGQAVPTNSPPAPAAEPSADAPGPIDAAAAALKTAEFVPLKATKTQAKIEGKDAEVVKVYPKGDDKRVYLSVHDIQAAVHKARDAGQKIRLTYEETKDGLVVEKLEVLGA